MSQRNSIEELASIISRNSSILTQQILDSGQTKPTLDEDSPADNATIFGSSKEVTNASRQLVQAARELQAIVQGPSNVLSLYAFAYHDISTLGVILQFKIATIVPLHGSITFSALAKKTGLLEDKLVRVLRYCFTNFIFQERPPGSVRHSSISAMLAKDVKFATYLQFVMVDLFPPASKLVESFARYPHSESPTETAMNVGNRTDKVFFSWLKEESVREQRFAVAMAGFSESGDRPQNTDVDAYPWHELPVGATVVDVAGGSGHVSIAIAKSRPDLKMIVQDSANVIAGGREAFWEQYGERNQALQIEYQSHDIFAPQPVKGADVYFFRQIMHDWPNKEGVEILTQQLKAMKPGSRVLISEYVVPDRVADNTSLDAKLIRQMDIQMMTIFNAKERTKQEFVDLFTATSPKLRFTRTYQAPADERSCIFEAIYEDDDLNGRSNGVPNGRHDAE